MVLLPIHRLAIAASENIVKQVGVTHLIKRAIGKREAGGMRWSERPVDVNLTHALAVSDVVTRHVDVRGKIGVEIGPGDNLATPYHLITQGAVKMYGVEKFDSIDPAWNRKLVLAINPTATNAENVLLARKVFEDFSPKEPIDFIYSHDVLEHVDPESVFRHAFKLLKPGGDFVHSVDLTGHNCFHNPQRPLDFLTCPDWLWTLLFSAKETTNRVRWSELLRLGAETGFELIRAHPIRRVKPNYLADIRPHLLPRFQRLSDDDLSVMQCELHFRKPAA